MPLKVVAVLDLLVPPPGLLSTRLYCLLVESSKIGLSIENKRWNTILPLGQKRTSTTNGSVIRGLFIWFG